MGHHIEKYLILNQMFQNIYHHTAGGLFSASSENMVKYIELFKHKVAEIYNNDWYQIDEAIMTMVQRENSDLFDFFYGDYQGIISNYLHPLHNIDLIICGLRKTIAFHRFDFAWHILDYLSNLFIENTNTEYLCQIISIIETNKEEFSRFLPK